MEGNSVYHKCITFLVSAAPYYHHLNSDAQRCLCSPLMHLLVTEAAATGVCRWGNRNRFHPFLPGLQYQEGVREFGNLSLLSSFLPILLYTAEG